MHMLWTSTEYFCFCHLLQVRVSAGVQVNSEPPEYEYNEPTKWELADRIIPSVPSPPCKTKQCCHDMTYYYVAVFILSFIHVYIVHLEYQNPQLLFL